ncbi:MAG: alpha/beta hydrolase-fold protein [Candidatus Krumholzibacteria bacterium]|nr:alpha/beta hydrolase-fold protein [Candidatus Krumholzibacteria bacterium]
MTRSPFRNLAALSALMALLAVSGAGPAALAQTQGTDIVLGKSIPLDSKILKRSVNVFVYVPPGYNQSAARYPVLYDLNSFFCFTYDCGTVELLARTMDIPNMIVVGVPQLGYGYVPTPFEERTDTLADADLSIQFLREELMPLVEKSYRTGPLKILYGHSVGGLFAMYTMFNYPDMFAGYLAGSPWFQSNDQYWLKNIEKFAKTRDLKGKYLYTTVGRGEAQITLDTYTGLEKWMLEAQLPGLSWKSAWVEGDHGSMSGRTIYDGLLFIFDGWKIPNALFMDADIDAVDQHVKKTAAKWSALGLDASSILPEAQINGMGYTMLQRKEYDKAVRIFLYNIKCFPKSFNAHDSLAEAYMTMGDKANAIKYYKLAVELNPGAGNYEKQILLNSQNKLRELGAEN